jgi:hypothetical protein
MTTSRNETSEASKAIWKKVDEAARRAPDWVRSNVSTLAIKRIPIPPEATEHAAPAPVPAPEGEK